MWDSTTFIVVMVGAGGQLTLALGAVHDGTQVYGSGGFTSYDCENEVGCLVA